MKKCDYIKEFDGYVFRPIREEDAEAYFEAGFADPDPEAVRLTASREDFTREEVLSFFRSCLRREDRADFLLISPEGRIVGESVLNEFDGADSSCNFRICIFSPSDRNRGLGQRMTDFALEYAFTVWRLRKVTLEVFSFNPRAEALYRSVGFRPYEVLPGSIRDGEAWGDIILMDITEPAWRAARR